MPEIHKHNHQYQKNEKKILRGYLAELRRVEAGGTISLTSISKASGLPYRTMLGHYRNFAELERSNIDETVSAACHLADECRLSGDDRRSFLKKLLLLVSRESTRFQIENTRWNIMIWKQVLSYSKDILTQGWSSYGKETDDTIFHRFCFEFIGTIFLWGKSGFSVTELEKHLTCLTHLCEIATKREMGL